MDVQYYEHMMVTSVWYHTCQINVHLVLSQWYFTSQYIVDIYDAVSVKPFI